MGSNTLKRVTSRYNDRIGVKVHSTGGFLF